jgi:chromosome segregation ATPase
LADLEGAVHALFAAVCSFESSMEEPQSPRSDTPATRSADALRALQDRAHSMLAARRERMSQLEAGVTRQLDAIAEMLAAQRTAEAQGAAEADQAQAEIDRLHEQLEQQSRELEERAKQLAERDQQMKAREAAIGQRAAEFVQREEELTQRQQELDLQTHTLQKREEEANTALAQQQALASSTAQREAGWQAERAVLEQERNQLAERLAKLEQQTQQSEREGADWTKRQAELERSLADQKAATDLLQNQWDRDRAALAAERDELQQKFALALEDVQRLRARVAELEQELAQRPQAGQADSTELVSLRAERDALAERVEKLENVPAASSDAANEQQLADLQRRFEMAVEDLRELKTKNARLESQLAASGKPAAGASDANSMDWESQKRRLLASLEGEGEVVDPQRHEERTKISDTIQITDAVIAEKDEEIQKLKAQLAAAPVAAPPEDGKRQQAVNELLDGDELIRQHRQKIAQHEQEMEAKLRAAELELSVERAKLARQKVELDQLRLDLEANRDSLAGGAAQAPGAPKRRWLSKLGLSGDES